MQLANRHIKGGVVGVLQVQKLLHAGRAIRVGALAQIHVDQALVATNAVRAVNDWVAHVEL